MCWPSVCVSDWCNHGLHHVRKQAKKLASELAGSVCGKCGEPSEQWPCIGHLFVRLKIGWECHPYNHSWCLCQSMLANASEILQYVQFDSWLPEREQRWRNAESAVASWFCFEAERQNQVRHDAFSMQENWPQTLGLLRVSGRSNVLATMKLLNSERVVHWGCTCKSLMIIFSLPLSHSFALHSLMTWPK